MKLVQKLIQKIKEFSAFNFQLLSFGKEGFTFIEILIAVTIFSITIVAFIALFSVAIRGQSITLASQELLDQTSYALEYMSRALRMAIKELDCTDSSNPATCSCLINKGYGYNYEILDGGTKIRFINHLQNDDCQEFYLEGNRLKYTKSGESFYLTSEDIKVITLKFDVSGASQDDILQPRITILLEAEKKGASPGESSKIKLQTSISQRNLDVQY
ncbi:prepilin-type N-terminal cleavage/methylation domain-containing protein [bacterium]|nr:prepilin-type N-terminal cleavage/methylation domain-containing protein [bacterium]